MPTKIEWATETWNPITGCTPCSEGCQNCYAKRMAVRHAGRYGYDKDEPFKVTFHPERLDQPRRWRKPRMVFVCSMGDLFHPDVTDYAIARIRQITSYAQHTFLILTKRPREMQKRMDRLLILREPFWSTNVWLGVTAENQKRAEERIPVLLNTPAAIRFVSLEPLLGPVDLQSLSADGPRFLGRFVCHHCEDEPTGYECGCCLQATEVTQIQKGLDWVIVGCETGPGRRPCKIEWIRDIVQQCKAAGVSCFVKKIEIDGKVTDDMSQWPADLRVREYPVAAFLDEVNGAK